MANPWKAVMDIRRGELPFALLMFTYFLLVITTFWILKPIKASLFIEYYDATGFDLLSWHLTAAQAELFAKLLNMGVAFVAVLVFTQLSRRWERQNLTYVFSAFFLLTFGAYGALLGQPSGATVWTFYLFGDLYSTVMVVTFFAFLNDAVQPEAARRVYGLIGFGGVLGGVIGATFFRVWIDSLSRPSWMWIAIGIGLLIALTAGLAGRAIPENPDSIPAPEPEPPQDHKPGALEGASLVFRSRYLLAIVAIVGLYEIVSTIVDFQFKATLSHFLDGEDIGRHQATVYAITNWVSMTVQLLLTSFVMTRLGVAIALAVLPVALSLGSTAFLLVPILWVGSSLNTADNGFSYSINQSAKETLYTPTTKDEKYKAKAFIDMFVQRFAKAVAVGISLLVSSLFADFSGVRWLSVVTLAFAVLWFVAVRYAGRRFHDLTHTDRAG
jgi:AAA family ATP:ADP antiporter